MPRFYTPLFCISTSNHSYLFSENEFRSEFTSKQSLILPLAHDSEWNNNWLERYLANDSIANRFHLSTQVKYIFNKPFCFFTQKAIEATGYDFLLPMKYDFVISDYLEQFGIQSTIEERDESNSKIPYLDVYLYSFLGIVDIGLLAKPDTLIYEIIKIGLANNNIRHEKRLTTNWNKPVTLPVTFSISDVENNFHPYQLRLFFIDIGAIHGNKGYKAVCQNVGIDVTAKSLMDEYKSDMLTGLKLLPDEYIAYANGDLNIYNVLVAFNRMMKDIYNELGLIDFFLSPKLTIGSTVADIVAASIFKWQNLPSIDYHLVQNKKPLRKTILYELMGQASADYLRTQLVHSYKALLGKIHGGRCHNNNPYSRYLEDTIADYDLAGAYSSIMAQLFLFSGTPWFYDSVEQDEISLKDFLKYHEHDFDDWHYTIVVSTNELLEYEQDFLVSWLDASTGKQKVINSDGSYSYASIAEYKSGYCKIFKREVVNCPITSDSVKWIRSLSKKVREDLLNKLIVKSAIGYKRKDKDKTWNSINLGELLINSLMQKRKEYKKQYAITQDSKFNSMQELYKLIINTVYGVMCSRHFITSNVVVANQITQAIRLGMYLMEKGLNLQGSITDGCMGSLNKVVYPLRKTLPKLDKLVNLYKYNSDYIGKNELRLGALDNAKNIALIWHKENNSVFTPQLRVEYNDRVELIDNVKSWIDDKAWQHLYNLFPDFRYLFEFLKIETKDVYDSYIYHGAANYQLKNPNYVKNAMRGYSGKKGVAIAIEYDVDSDSLIQLDDYDDKSIPQVFISQLTNNVIEKLPVFVMPKILKSKDYKQHNYIERSKLICGDEIPVVGLPNYCSLSQYTFQTIEQYEIWKRLYTRLKNSKKYQTGESFEIFFTDKEGKLHYDDMVKELCTMIDIGVQNPIGTLSKKHPIRITKISKRYETKLQASLQRNLVVFTNEENEDEIVELVD